MAESKKNSQKEQISVKIVIIGDGAIGKTCILQRYCSDKFDEQYIPTVFENKFTTVNIDGQMINLGLWDTAGQDEYQKMRGLAYSGADLFIIAFSVIDRASFDNAIKKWYPELQESAPKCQKVFFGNKIDLRSESVSYDKNAHILKEVAEKTIGEIDCSYYECSAKSGVGIKEAFLGAIRQVVAQKLKNPSSNKGKSKNGKKGVCNLI